MSTADTRSSRFRDLTRVLGVVVLFLLTWPAAPVRAADTFESMAKRNTTLKTALAAYDDAREASWALMEEELTRAATDYEDVADVADDIETTLAASYLSLFDGMELELDALTEAVRSASVPDKQALLEAYKEWLDAELADYKNAKIIGSRINFTIGTVALRYRTVALWIDKELPARKTLHELGASMSKAFVRAEEILALEEDAARFKTEAALFLPMTYHAKTLQEAVVFRQEEYELWVKEQRPTEELGGKITTARRLIQEAEFADPGWAEALEAGAAKLEELVTRLDGYHVRLAELLEPWIEGNTLRDCGRPFDKIDYDEIRDTFGALYGKLAARAI